jgi:DNA-binding IclR family transcriptional regulator
MKTMKSSKQPAKHTLPQRSKESGGVQSLETGMRVLTSFMELDPLPMLKEIAEKSGMPPAKAHRYLASFCRSGYVARDVETGRYCLGNLALRLGLSAMNGLDIVRVARPLLGEARDALGHSVLLAVWGSRGPTVVQMEQTRSPISVTTRVGLVLPLLSSSTGRVFAAWLPRAETHELLAHELARTARARPPGVPASATQAEALFQEVRKHGMARVMGQLNPGVSALSAPVFDHSAQIVAVISTLGPAGSVDTAWNGGLGRKLRQKADALSTMLGYRPSR